MLTCESLHALADIAPYLQSSIMGDVGISIIEGDSYLAYIPAQSLDFNIKAQDKVKPGSVIDRCLQEKRQIIVEVSRDKSVYGVPYVANAVPIQDDKGQIIGCICTSQSTDSISFLRETSQVLKDSSGHLANSIQGLSTQADKLGDSGYNLEKLAVYTLEVVNNTNEIVEFIKDVSRRTNVLGINASIEACRVGAAGRGFGVVAEEVRKLAANSAESGNRINQILVEIKKAITDVMKQSVEIKDSVHHQASIIQELASSSEELAAMSQEIEELAERIV